MNKAIFLILFLFSFSFVLGQGKDTVKINLRINDSTVSDPSQLINFNFKNKTGSENIIFRHDIIVFNSHVNDTIELAVAYQGEEIISCFNYALIDLAEIKGLTIEIFTQKYPLEKKLKSSSLYKDREKRKIKSLFVVTFNKKNGYDDQCYVKNWKNGR